MRFAITAMAAVSGVLLMGLAVYGQPAVYVHQAREEWDALLGTAPSEPAADLEHDASADSTVHDSTARLRQQVQRLEHELAAKRAAADRSARTVVAPAEAPVVRQPAAPLAAPAVQPGAPTRSMATAAGSSRPASQPPAQPLIAPAQPVPPPVQTTARQPGIAQTPPSEPAPSPAPSSVEPLSQPLVAAAAAPPAVTVPARHEAAAPEAAHPRSRAPRIAEPPPPTSDPAFNIDTELPEPPKVVPQKLASVTPSPAPPPLPPRQDADDARSVLARLRQSAPAPAEQADAPPPTETHSRPARSPSLPKLAAARAALGSGKVDAARRLLQEAQLQLVFRPVGGSDDDLPSAGKGAADVAHALEALSANDVPLSRRYIDGAIGDLSGNGVPSPVQESQFRATGYAPAYPPR